MDFIYYIAVVILRYVLLLASAIGLIVSIVFLVKRKRLLVPVIIFVASLLFPCFFFFHGTYRNNHLDISEKNIGDIVAALDKLDYNPRHDRETVCVVNNNHYDTHRFVGVYESMNDGVYIAVEKFEGRETTKELFESHSGVCLEEPFLNNGFKYRYKNRIKLEQIGNYTLVTSAMVANTLGEPLRDCGYLFLGEYYGYFDIQTSTNIYSIIYSIDADYGFLNNLLCLPPRNISAERLLEMFNDFPNEYHIDFSEN